MTFDNIQQAASALGLEYHHLAGARRLGCTCFRNSKVYTAGLIEWLRKNRAEVSDVTWDDGIKLYKPMIDRAEKKLLALERAQNPAPAVDPLAGIEARMVGLTLEQATALASEIRLHVLSTK